ncbi:MAG TPA: DUF1993 domain-containing protein [Casimicrobiaceae bacterium]|nr:DUF1993 domain-containing protein [Casimicrobiaceae bacterium]
MTISMYQASVPVFTKGLTNLKAILEKAAAHAAARKIDETVLAGARLFPDMLPLTKQVQIASDFARGTTARLAGSEPPAMEDNEKTLADLIARVDRTLDFLKPFTAAQIDGSETRQITRPVRGQPRTFTGINYLLHYALPNFYFHTVTAYDILRHNGVEIGKLDFIGSLD